MKFSRRSLWIFALLFAAVVAAGAWFLTRDRDEARIRAVVAGFTERLSKSPTEAPGISLAKVAGMEKLFAPQVEFDFPREKFHRTLEAREISAKAGAYRNFFSEAKFRVSDLVFLSRDSERAVVEGMGLLNGRLAGRGEAVEDSREIEMEFVRIDGEWRIRRITVREVLQK